jgi:hypothetical protein
MVKIRCEKGGVRSLRWLRVPTARGEFRTVSRIVAHLVQRVSSIRKKREKGVVAEGKAQEKEKLKEMNGVF